MTDLISGAAVLFSAAALILLAVVLVRQGRLEKRLLESAQRQEELTNQVTDELLEGQTRLQSALTGETRHAAEHLSALHAQAGAAQSALLEAMQRQLFQALSQLDARQEQLRQSISGDLKTLRQDNDRQLSEMRRTVDEKLTESLDKRLSDSFAQVSRRLEQVYRGLGEMQTLASGVGDLKKVLTNVKTRGVWGEMQLSSLLSQLLAPNQYSENVEIVPGSGERVEFAIRLPGQTGDVIYLPVDSKFPQEDYLRLVEASQDANAAAVEEARRALMARIRTEAKRISGKYIVPPCSTDFAVMFLPVEGLYAEVVRSLDTVETIQREQRVVIAGPSTFAALLNALQMGFRTLAIEQRSSEVWQLLGAVKTDFGRFAETLEKTRLRLQQASETIDTAYSRTKSIERRLSAVEPNALPEDTP